MATSAFIAFVRKETVWFAMRCEEEYLWLAHEASPKVNANSNTNGFLMMFISSVQSV